MCGITGLWFPGAALDQASLEGRARSMAERLVHRGPDGDGSWCDAGAGVAFGHRRLAILDLSEAGHQPMLSADGRWVLSYNGEIYNHRALRQELIQRGVTFRGHSDSEVLVELIAALGVARALDAVDGMFAAALWDRRERQLWLARDPFGEKPLYYAQVSGGVVFASELRSLRACPEYASELDHSALALYLRYGYVPAPYAIDRAARKLDAGSVMCVQQRGAGLVPGAPLRYFDAEAVARNAIAERVDAVEGMQALAAAFAGSVKGRMESDVPLGAFLSGGIDSSAVVAEMCAQSAAPVQTFTVAFSAFGFDESPAAAAVAAHLGTTHKVFRLGEDDALDCARNIAGAYDEPFADSSQLPTRLIAGAARDSVTVALTGDGGDELFGGYNRHIALPRLNALAAGWPRGMRRPAAAALSMACTPRTAPAWEAAQRLLPASRRTPQLREKMAKVAQLLREDDMVSRYRRVCMLDARPERLLGTSAPPLALPAATGLAEAEWMMIADTLTYLPDDILVKVDRASMNVSLETRTPFLNRDLYRAAWRLPPELRIDAGKGKRALRELALRHVPATLLDRPKAGFAVPLAAWLRGPLKDWAGELLQGGRVRAEGLFDAHAVARMWQEHQLGRVDHAHRLWTLLMFQSWSDASKP